MYKGVILLQLTYRQVILRDLSHVVEQEQHLLGRARLDSHQLGRRLLHHYLTEIIIQILQIVGGLYLLIS